MLESIAMSSIRTNASILTAVMACLVLHAAMDGKRKETPPGSLLATRGDLPSINRQPGPIPVQHEPASESESRTALLIGRKSRPLLVDSTTALQSIGSLPEPYPEFAQITELENLPAETALAELLPMLSDSDPALRYAAIQSLGDMTARSALPALLAALHDSDPRLRAAALAALASHGDSTVVDSIEPCLFDQEREVRMAAIEALTDLDVESAVHSLGLLLTERDSLIRRRAVFALGEASGEDALMYLLQARYDPDTVVRANVEQILTELDYEAVK